MGGRSLEGWWVWSTAAKAGGDDGFDLAFHDVHREGFPAFLCKFTAGEQKILDCSPRVSAIYHRSTRRGGRPNARNTGPSPTFFD